MLCCAVYCTDKILQESIQFSKDSQTGITRHWTVQVKAEWVLCSQTGLWYHASSAANWAAWLEGGAAPPPPRPHTEAGQLQSELVVGRGSCNPPPALARHAVLLSPALATHLALPQVRGLTKLYSFTVVQHCTGLSGVCYPRGPGPAAADRPGHALTARPRPAALPARLPRRQSRPLPRLPDPVQWPCTPRPTDHRTTGQRDRGTM